MEFVKDSQGEDGQGVKCLGNDKTRKSRYDARWPRLCEIQRNMARKAMESSDFFATSEPTESQRYELTEVIGKGSYGVVSSAVDRFNRGMYL